MGILEDIKEAVVGTKEVEEVAKPKKAKKEDKAASGVKQTGVKTTGVK